MRLGLHHALALLVALVPLSVQSDMLCQFVTECFEGEACDETNFELKLVDAEEPDAVMLGSVSDNVSGEIETLGSGAQVISAQGPSSWQLLSIGPEGEARYTLHLTEGPAVLSYLGTCEAEK